ncbi:Lrp/AsnC family transcriptional regulator [Acidianus sp. RZ1]|uniref:Lrp/AsnC family transcriptional regulator n=1 Tax=Acidianus sp. RZ1 TaxID=1540082 RepID=UPI001492A264|nr:Lrp/AsnC family transcriptional regulator [Acidianus sp. RZ1]NON62301.1 Lrp/AsnC family transcriptional regulator [Acidianus sp. RZ1]
MELDDEDLKIIRILQEDARYPLHKLAEQLHMPKTTVAYRIKRLEKRGIIRGYHAKIDPFSLNLEYVVITMVKAKYGERYHEIVGSKLAKLPGVWGVYFVLGEMDFVLMARYKNRQEFMHNFLEKIMEIPEIERTTTQVVVNVIKEEPNKVLF